MQSEPAVAVFQVHHNSKLLAPCAGPSQPIGNLSLRMQAERTGAISRQSRRTIENSRRNTPDLRGDTSTVLHSRRSPVLRQSAASDMLLRLPCRERSALEYVRTTQPRNMRRLNCRERIPLLQMEKVPLQANTRRL